MLRGAHHPHRELTFSKSSSHVSHWLLLPGRLIGSGGVNDGCSWYLPTESDYSLMIQLSVSFVVGFRGPAGSELSREILC